MKGKIFINPFGVPKQSVEQAERLKEEFNKLGVSVEISSEYFRAGISVKALEEENEGLDFGVYLDKDKYLSLILEDSGLRLFNSHKSIRICDDKGETYVALKNNSFNLPKTLFAPVCYKNDLAIPEYAVNRIESELSYPVIIKESFGSMGKGVHKAENRRELVSLMNDLKTTSHFYQEFLQNSYGTDLRVIAIGGSAVAVMERKNKNDFRSNIALGGVGRNIAFDDPFYADYIKEAERVSQVLQMDYCGVDVLIGKDGKPVICEVNSNAFFSEIEKISKVNVAKLYCEYVIKTLSK